MYKKSTVIISILSVMVRLVQNLLGFGLDLKKVTFSYVQFGPTVTVGCPVSTSTLVSTGKPFKVELNDHIITVP